MAQSMEAVVFTPLNRLGQPAAGKITLHGWATPHDQPNFDTEQRTVKDEYAGNPEATIQKLGVSYPNTTFKGEFHHGHTVIQESGLDLTAVDAGSPAPATTAPPALDPSTLTTPERLQRAFERLCAVGQDVEVGWAGELRRGVIKKTSFRPRRRQDIVWELELEWSAKLGAIPPPLVITPFPMDAPSQLQVLFDGLAAIIEAPLAVPGAIIQKANTFMKQLQNGADELTDALQQPQQLVSEVTTVAKRAISVLASIQNESLAMAMLINQIRSDSLQVANDAEQLIDFEAWRQGLVFQISGIYRHCRDSQENFAASISQIVITSYRAKGGADGTGQDMRDIAIQTTGNPLDWQMLCDFNDFDQSFVPSGSLVLIPRTA